MGVRLQSQRRRKCLKGTTLSATSLIVKRSIDIAAEPAKVWKIIVSPAYWPKWMIAPPAMEPSQTAIRLGSEVQWKNERGEVYLTGTVTALDPESCLVLELEDVSWSRRAAPGEVTYRMEIIRHGEHTHVNFRLGDLSIDPESEEWYGFYINSRELEKIKELAEADASLI
jgi:uncharacterized protein YndB with AHSA1/START domain